jgi:hypothetical protein
LAPVLALAALPGRPVVSSLVGSSAFSWRR